MSESASLPTTMPVEFVERTVYMASEFGAYRPQLGGVVLFDGRLDETRLMRATGLAATRRPRLHPPPGRARERRPRG
jgi:hypothetical protein